MALPDDLTAVSPSFPSLLACDFGCICFNLRQGDADIVPDPYFHWQGSYFELDWDGRPLIDCWKNNLKAIANDVGASRVAKFCGDFERDGRMFYSPSKTKRWGRDIMGDQCEKPLSWEQVLVRRQLAADRVTWTLYELDPESDATREHELHHCVLKRITYPVLWLDSDKQDVACKSVFAEFSSSIVWLDGSTFVRLKNQSSDPSRIIYSLPKDFAIVRYVPISEREHFLASVSMEPTCAVTGATLPAGTPHGSCMSVEVAVAVGKAVAEKMQLKGVSLMASASMRGHNATMSADHDLTLGFESVVGCDTVHFKGINAVRLAGDAWRMNHGLTYVLEEDSNDFSNNAKEACLMACGTNARSFALCANGGPTVACNVVRFLMLCRPKRVFTICGMHGQSGLSGAAASFNLKVEQIVSYLESLIELAPSFFKGKVKTNQTDILQKMSASPLRLLEVDADKGCVERPYYIVVGSANSTPSPGFTLDDATRIPEYADKLAAVVARTYDDHGGKSKTECIFGACFCMRR
eukprot:TRINITY_DN29340_c0_g1_i1.p1 TRINITY_DN29340_c0_g1~~TRINITY_DN29340_c0_g1_i1.p1  ORF type:complete len:540 (-),score=23.95 TRINITY_DN29340_c0_g1_i1:88-1656(-)